MEQKLFNKNKVYGYKPRIAGQTISPTKRKLLAQLSKQQKTKIILETCSCCLKKIKPLKDISCYCKYGEQKTITKYYTTQKEYDNAISFINCNPVCTHCFLEKQNWLADRRTSASLLKSKHTFVWEMNQ